MVARICGKTPRAAALDEHGPDARPARRRLLGVPQGSSNEGPHALICEYVAGVAAQAIGLNIPPFAVVEDYIDDAPKVFVSKLVEGADPWDGTSATLARVANIEMFALVPVFDTWVLNWDRYVPGKEPNYGNVLVAKDSLVAIDHTHCLGRKVTGSLPKSWSIELWQDGQLRGAFPEFLARVDSTAP